MTHLGGGLAPPCKFIQRSKPVDQHKHGIILPLLCLTSTHPLAQYTLHELSRRVWVRKFSYFLTTLNKGNLRILLPCPAEH